MVTSDIESKEVLNFPLKDLPKDYIELALECYLAQTPYNFPLPSTPMTSTTPPTSSKESNGKNQNIDLSQVINLIFTSIGIVVAAGVALYVSLANKIDNVDNNLGNKIDNGNQEIRNLVNSAIRDFNNRIDTTNQRVDTTDQRIDQVYQTPPIKSS